MTPEQLENGRVWVAALRSGKYKQGKNALKRDDGTYCCLGVACDLFADAYGLPWALDNYGTWEVIDPQHVFPLNATLPITLQRALGIKGALGIVNGRTLAYLNDSEGMDFNGIADVIEKEIYGITA